MFPGYSNPQKLSLVICKSNMSNKLKETGKFEIKMAPPNINSVFFNPLIFKFRIKHLSSYVLYLLASYLIFPAIV